MLFATLEHWVNINSGSHNYAGLRLMADALQEHLADLPAECERIAFNPVTELDGSEFQPGEALRLRFRQDAPLKVLFSGHMDTVYDNGHAFQRLRHLDDGRLNGPGVADMKGGLCIMIEAVRRFLESDSSGNIGGEILITADEEIGSPASHGLIVEAARENDIGLVYESALPGGELVCQRKGTGTFRMIARGKSAHTGRDFANGRNAVVALSGVLTAAHRLNETYPDAIINVGRVSGGGPVNVVPDRAEAWLNLRVGRNESVAQLEAALAQLVSEAGNGEDGVHIELEGAFTRPPKEESRADAVLHDYWNRAETKLGMKASGKRETGGSSDGNILASEDLPHLDGVGIRGGAIHSEDEFAIPGSIEEQINKTRGFLEILAADPQDAKTRLQLRDE